MTPQPPPAPAAGSGKGGLAPVLLGVVGLCCFPFGIVAFVMGLMAFNQARREGRSAPGSAVASMVLGVLSLVFLAGFVGLGVKLAKERDDAAAALDKKLAGKLDAATLDQETACDLARQFLITEHQRQPDEIQCVGPLTGQGVLKLEGVTSGPDKEARVLCLARAHRWFVFSEPGDGVCPTEGPSVPAGQPGSSEALVAEEKRLREAERERRVKAVVADFDAQARQVLLAIDGHAPGTVGACGADFSAAKGRALRFVDHSQLRKREAGDWDFMTHSEFRQALDKVYDLKERGEAIEKIARQGPWVIVFQEEEPRRWPEVQGSISFDSGDYVGWLRLVDWKKGAVVCEAPLEFFNSADVSTFRLTKLESKEHALERAVEKDFKKQFELATGKALNAMSKGQLGMATSIFD
ncbi:MAG: DUF4190 domain-containing protein [Myxococcota bacterium]